MRNFAEPIRIEPAFDDPEEVPGPVRTSGSIPHDGGVPSHKVDGATRSRLVSGQLGPRTVSPK